MSKHLVESIIDQEYVLAEAAFREQLDAIMERKLYEYKTTIDLTERVEATGGKDEDGNPQYKGQNSKKDWAEFRKANPTMSFHGTPANPKAKSTKDKHEKSSTGSLTKHGIAMRRKRGYLPANDAINAKKFIDAVRNYKETGKVSVSEQNALQKTPFGRSLDVPVDKTPTPRDPSQIAKSAKKTGASGRPSIADQRKIMADAIRARRRAHAVNQIQADADKKFQAHQAKMHPEPGETKVSRFQKFKNGLAGRDMDYTPEKETETQKQNKRRGAAGIAGQALRGAATGFASGLTNMGN